MTNRKAASFVQHLPVLTARVTQKMPSWV